MANIKYQVYFQYKLFEDNKIYFDFIRMNLVMNRAQKEKCHGNYVLFFFLKTENLINKYLF